MYRFLIITILALASSPMWSARAQEAAVDSLRAVSDTVVPAQLPDSVAAAFQPDSLAHALQSDTIPYTPTLYDFPYSVSRSCKNWKNLWINTGVLFGAGFVTLGVLELLPESATAWNKAEIHKKPIFERWWTNVKKGPVWDHDNAIFNYVLHPYGGAAYYMSARSQGFNMLQSFVYGAAISTFFWEYGIEAFMEVPSIQDLFITPIGGLLVGETFYRIKRYIVEHDYRLLGSPVLGQIVAILVDPVNEVIDFVRGNPNKNYSRRHSPRPGDARLSVQPWVGGMGGLPGAKAGFTVECVF